ncbi:hypothetical protein JMG10_17300 [Nostoc ellipsosporum NOK]|nr:hypothetical protein [Nostoc ellipsosporum NOK]
MREPLALKLASGDGVSVLRAGVDPRIGRELAVKKEGAVPAMLIVRKAMLFAEQETALIDLQEVVGAVDGDWENALLLIIPEQGVTESVAQSQGGDTRFIEHVERTAPGLVGLADQVLKKIRASGVEGSLFEASKGRWVNRPINSFTLKVQPRVGNLHFTIYGNPGAFDEPGFLRQDQNSYSRGWVRSLEDADQLARLVRQAHSRRNR